VTATTRTTEGTMTMNTTCATAPTTLNRTDADLLARYDDALDALRAAELLGDAAAVKAADAAAYTAWGAVYRHRRARPPVPACCAPHAYARTCNGQDARRTMELALEEVRWHAVEMQTAADAARLDSDSGAHVARIANRIAARRLGTLGVTLDALAGWIAEVTTPRAAWRLLGAMAFTDSMEAVWQSARENAANEAAPYGLGNLGGRWCEVCA
jgi:hypothetical protein